MTDLVGKKKLVINQDSWGAPQRSGSQPLPSSPDQFVSVLVWKQQGNVFFNVQHWR